MTEHVVAAEVLELAPEPPPKSVQRWLKDNLFSTVASSVMTIVALLVALAAIRGLLGFIFAPSRRWEAVTFNMRLLMVQAYPQEQTLRVWFTVAFVVMLFAASLAVWRVEGRTTPKQIGGVLMAVGGMIALGGVLGPFSLTGKITWLILAVLLLVGGYLLRTMPGDRAKEESVPILGVVAVLIVGLLVVVWTIVLPFPSRDPSGAQVVVFEPVAMSTRIPWTVIAALGIGTYVLFRLVRDVLPQGTVRRIIIGLWVLAYPFLVLVVLRDPHIEMDRVWSWYLPLAVGAILVGGFLVNLAATRSLGELGRIIGAVALVVALASFAIPMEFVVRFLLLGFAFFTLAAPTFGGEGRSRRVFLGLWAVTAALTVFFYVVTTSESTVEVPGAFMLGGLALTLILSISAIAASFPIGLLLALGRTSKMPIFRLMSTAYIELIRGVPLITWLLVAFLMLPVALPEGVTVGGVMRAIAAMTFFSAAYLAENVRGGLQSIPKGQYEASQALGMTTAQMNVFIVLPQALRAVIPALVGQIIAIFKDTSLVTIVGLFDFLHIARSVIPGQSQPFNFLGTFREPLLFAAVVYWMFTFSFSRVSLRLEKKLGVGER